MKGARCQKFSPSSPGLQRNLTSTQAQRRPAVVLEAVFQHDVLLLGAMFGAEAFEGRVVEGKVPWKVG